LQLLKGNLLTTANLKGSLAHGAMPRAFSSAAISRSEDASAARISATWSWRLHSVGLSQPLHPLILSLFSRGDPSPPKLSHDGPELRPSAKNLFSQAAKLTPQAIPFSDQFSVGPLSQSAGERLLGQAPRDLTQLRQCYWADPWNFQPLGIRDVDYVPNRGTTPAKLSQDRISHSLRKPLNREWII
jgi:hypothetical protein